MSNKKVLKIKVRSFKNLDTKTATTDGVVEAIVSVFGNVDSYAEIVDKGAFNESLQKKLPKGVWSHDWQQPIAKTLEAYETEKGLYIKFQLIKGVQKADEALLLMQAGAIDEFSIGYEVMEDYIGADGFRHLKRLRLYEYSPVLVGANSETELISVKGFEKEIEVDEETVPRVVTQEDLDANPSLVEQGVQVGDEIELPIEAVGDGVVEGEPKEGEEEAKAKAPAEGDACTMEDGTAGVMKMDEDGNMVCVLPEAGENSKGLKDGRVLSATNRALIEQVVNDAETLSKALKNLSTPLKELLNATENAGGKVVPISADPKRTVRIREAIKTADRSLGFVLKILKTDTAD